ncbi:MAG: hypothetical protein ACE37F_16455 [Nannocystaceae bacterium]|nr:hypothetical protein [bacterium]
MKRINTSLSLIATLALLSTGCDDSTGDSTLRFAAWGEDFIEQGIPADEFVDGWDLTFDSFAVSIEGVSADGESLPGSFDVELTRESGGMGHELGTLVVPADGVPMVSWTITSLAASGSATRDGVTKSFDWSFDVSPRYIECDTETPLVEGETTDVFLTVHGDHLFFDDLDSSEPQVAFDLIAEADANDDGEVTLDELRGQSLDGQVRYQVGGRDIDSLYGFIEAQALLVGHINGEGHCEIE